MFALDTKSIGILLRNVDTPILVMALRGAPALVIDQMLGCLSSRAADGIRDELGEGRAKRSDVEDAQRQIATIARRLADDGELELGTQGSDDYV